MEKLILKRELSTLFHTHGELWYNNKFICYTLEDPVREVKIKNKTAIPQGTYEVIIVPSPRFGLKMPRLLNVPLFSGILIHKGNTAEDSSGCILVGMEKTDKGLLRSTPAYTKVYQLIEKLLQQEKVFIEIINKPKEKEEINTTDIPKEISIVQNNKIEEIVEPVLTQTEEVKTQQTNIQPNQDLPQVTNLNTISWKNYFLNLWRSILTWFKIRSFHKLTTNQSS